MLPKRPMRIVRKGRLKRSGGRIIRSVRLKTAPQRIKPKKTPKGTPAWLKCIPRGLHGSGHLQQRLWRLKSDFVRIRDWETFGTCIATNKKLNHWNDGQAGHYRAYSECRGMFKFNEINIHLQTAQSNSFATSTHWETFADNLVKRYGVDIIHAIDHMNQDTPLKITTELVLEEIETTINQIGWLKHKPPYWNRLIKLRTHLSQE